MSAAEPLSGEERELLVQGANLALLEDPPRLICLRPDAFKILLAERDAAERDRDIARLEANDAMETADSYRAERDAAVALAERYREVIDLFVSLDDEPDRGERHHYVTDWDRVADAVEAALAADQSPAGEA